ncbi:type II secretion system protein [Planctomycetota bacterium]
MSKISGFTLIELLVVIATIALLLAMLMPALRKASDHAKSIKCLSNLKQIGLAAHLYAETFDGFIPRGSWGDEPIWFRVFFPFLGYDERVEDWTDIDIYRCPSYPIFGDSLNGLPNQENAVCFVINGWGYNGADIHYPTKLVNVRKPGEKIYLADNETGFWRPVITGESSEGFWWCDIFHTGHLPMSDDTDLINGRRIARDRHGRGCNCLFFDWHAENRVAEEMTEFDWHDGGPMFDDD